MSFPYHINDVVLARVPNGKIYYTKIRSISLARKECVAEFDDGSVAAVDWINIFDVAAETDVIVCVVCKLGESEPPNEIILCDTCNVGYHQLCHPTIITSQHIAQEKWHCFYCVSKEKNPYIKNPFENSRSTSPRSPIKRKRKLVKEAPQQKKIPKKRRKLHRSPPKPPKTSKSFVAKKCTVSIIKKPIPIVPKEFSDASNCSSDQALIPEETRSVHTPSPPPVPPPTLPIRPVNTVQPLNHNMAYPVCSPPPLQMSPLVKKTPRLQSYSPPPLMTPRDVTVNHSALMTSLPPLQKARDMDSDPLRSIPDCPSSSWTHNTSKPSSKLKKSPVCSTRPVKSEASPQERSEIVENTTIIPPNPFLEHPPQLPSGDLVSNISSDQIRGLYMRLYDFLQQTRAQGNPVIDREVVQHLISYGNEQIQRLSSAGSISNSEQLDGSSSSQVTSLNSAGNTTDLSSRGTSSSSENSVETSAKNNLKKVLEQDSTESQKPDSNIERITAHVAASPAGGKITEQLPPRSNSRQTSVTDQELESLRSLMNQDGRGISAHIAASPAVLKEKEQPPLRSNSGKSLVTNKEFESLSLLIDQEERNISSSGKETVIPPILNSLSSPFEVFASPQESSTLTKNKEPVSNLIEVPISSKTVLIKATSSAQPKFDAELKPTKKIISQPLEPFNLAMMGPFIQDIKKKKIKKIPVNRKMAKAVIVKNQEKKKKQLKRPTKSVPSRKRPKPDPPMSSIYTAVQAGNSVIITPNSACNPSTKNSVPVQFITEVDVPSNTDSSADFSKTFAEYPYSATNQKVSDLPSPAQCSLPTTPLLPVQMSSTSIPVFGSNKPIGPSTLNGPLTSISACTNHVSFSLTGDGIAPSNHLTLPKTSVVPPFEQSISCPTETVSQKNDSIIRKFHSVETSSMAPKSNDIVKTIPTIPFQLTMTPTQHPFEKVASPASTVSIPSLGNVIKNEETSLKPQLKNDDISTSDAKQTSASGRSGLPRKSKNQANHNIKSFTIFDSYSSLFDSDGDEDDVFVTQKPASQTSSELRDVGNYNRMALPVSQGSENFGPDSNNTQILDKLISSQTSSEGKSMTSTTNAVSQEISQTTPFSATLFLDELFDTASGSSTGPNHAYVSNTRMDHVSVVPSFSSTRMDPVSVVQSVSSTRMDHVSVVSSVSSTRMDRVSVVPSVSNTRMDHISVLPSVSSTRMDPVSVVPSISNTRMDHVSVVPYVSSRKASPEELASTSSTLTTRQHPATFHCKTSPPPASSPSDQKHTTVYPNKSVILMARGISQVLHQMLMVASVKTTSELAIRAAVIRLEERATSVNFLTATLLHELITVAVSSLKKIRDTAPVTNSQNPSLGSDAFSQNSTLTSAAFSQNVTPAPVVCSQNLFSKPVACSQNVSPTPVACSQNVSPAPVACSQNVSPAPVACSQNVSPAPVTCSQNVSPAPVACSQNFSPAPVACSQNVSPAPVACSQNSTSVPIDCSQNISPNPIANRQNLCSTPGNNNSTESEKLTTTNIWDENREPNKNKITGQCYNCYSTAQITCRRCATALYCSLRCELEHLAIHRRECCKRQS
ncbi:mucin-2-like [Bolinopsis microptera]|uniref:mucin-2-like n=1 Tax=Bolinopsis microptera TaxID=2820187 RepID=UPI00307AC187